MGMSNMLKTFVKHLLIPYGIVLGINIFLCIIGCIVNSLDDVLMCYYSLSINAIFSFLIGYILYGSYGRTFALIQNNKKSFVLSSLLLIVLNSILLTLFIFLFILIASNISIKLFSLLLLFCLYLGVAYFGCLYGLMVKNKKIIRLFFMIIALGLCVVFINHLVNEIQLFLLDTILYNSNMELLIKSLISFGIISITLCIICNSLYLKLNIAKVYSHE